MATLRTLTTLLITDANGNRIDLEISEAQNLVRDMIAALPNSTLTKDSEAERRAHIEQKLDLLVNILHDRMEKQPKVIDAIKLVRELGNLVKQMVGLKEAKDFVEHLMTYTGVKCNNAAYEMPETTNDEFFKKLKELILDRRMYNNTYSNFINF